MKLTLSWLNSFQKKVVWKTLFDYSQMFVKIKIREKKEEEEEKFLNKRNHH